MFTVIMEQAQSKFWEELGKDLLKRAAATIVTEVVRTQVDLWKQIRLKRMRRNLDVVWREEDLLYKERREQQKTGNRDDKTSDRQREDVTPPVMQPPPSPEDRRGVISIESAQSEDTPSDETLRGDEEADGTLSRSARCEER